MYGELIARIRYHIQKADFMGLKEYESTRLLNEAADAIEELEKQLDEETEYATALACNVPYWIPVMERFPNCNGCYLVWRPHFFGGEIGMPSICYFDGSNTWHDSYGVDFARILHPEDVTHWMLLPEPPEDGES